MLHFRNNFVKNEGLNIALADSISNLFQIQANKFIGFLDHLVHAVTQLVCKGALKICFPLISTTT